MRQIIHKKGTRAAVLAIIFLGCALGLEAQAATTLFSGCAHRKSSLTLTSPAAGAALTPGSTVTVTGRISHPGNTVPWGNCPKIEFWLTEDTNINVRDCCGRTVDRCCDEDENQYDCSTGISCSNQPDCYNRIATSYGAVGKAITNSAGFTGNPCDYGTCQDTNKSGRLEVKYLNPGSSKAYKLGEEIYPTTTYCSGFGSDIYYAFNKTLTIPSSVSISGPARIYIQYESRGIGDSYVYTEDWRWLVAYQQVNVAASCSCGSWSNGSCAAGGCSATQRQQTRTCSPSGCNTASQCVTDSSCGTSNVTISGRVTNNSGSGLAGVAIDTCGATVTTNSTGNWSRTVASGTSYCARISTGLPSGYTAIRGTSNNACNPNASTYEWQVAGQNQYASCSYTDQRAWDLLSDSNINFTVDYPAACSCSSWSNGSCAAGGCLTTQRQQTRTCSPSGCNTASQCVTDSSCGTSPLNNAQYVSQSVPAAMNAGQTYSVSITMKNIGTTTWSTAGNYNLGSQNPQDNGTWGLGRVGVGGSIAPGSSKTFTFNVTAPSAPGTYNFQWRMVQDGVEWFGDYTPNIVVTVASSCSCGSWGNSGCGLNGCALAQMSQSRTCSPANCLAQTQCVNDSACPPSLTLALQVNPWSGSAPLNSVITGTVGGSAIGTINYTTWWNCNNTCSTVAACQSACGTWDNKADGVSATVRTLNHTYAAAGTYYAKMVVERQSMSVQGKVQVTVNSAPTLAVSLSAAPPSGAAPLASTLTSAISGTAAGTINYTYWWNCNNTCSTVAACQSACGAFDFQALNQTGASNSASHSYAPAGNYYAKVVVERGGLNAEARAAIAVTAPLTLTVSFSATPSTGGVPLNTVLAADVGGTMTGTINYTAWWNCGSACATVAACQSACGTWDDKADGAVSATRTINHAYSSVGSYAPKIVVERGSLAAEARASVTVINEPPSASTLINQADYCGSGLATRFSWAYSDPENDPQAYYQVQIDDNSDFSSPVDDSGKVASATDSYAVTAAKLAYDTAYHWRLMVWDDKGNNSGWILGPDFSTPLHTYPKVDSSWIPATPTVDEEIVFTDNSTVYGGAAVTGRAWVFDGAVPASGTAVVMKVKYAAKNDYTVKLTVTDSSGYTCSGDFDVTVKKGLPDWEEQ